MHDPWILKRPIVISIGNRFRKIYLFLVADTCRSVGPSGTFLNSERFSHYCSSPTVCDWIAGYPALLNQPETRGSKAKQEIDILTWSFMSSFIFFDLSFSILQE